VHCSHMFCAHDKKVLVELVRVPAYVWLVIFL